MDFADEQKKENAAFLTRGEGQTYLPTWGSNPCQLFYQGTNRAESSQKIGQKIWKINQITSKCHVGTNGSGDKNLPNNEVGQIDGGQIWGETWQKRGKIGQKLRKFGKYGMRFSKYGMSVMRIRENGGFEIILQKLIDKRDEEEDAVKLVTFGVRDVSQAAEDDDVDDDDENGEEVAKLDTIGRRDVSQAEL